MKTTAQKTILAALSQCVADRDKAIANISNLLERDYDKNNDNVTDIKKAFDDLHIAEAIIETIQLYYAKNYPLPTEEKNTKENDNNS